MYKSKMMRLIEQHNPSAVEIVRAARDTVYETRYKGNLKTAYLGEIEDTLHHDGFGIGAHVESIEPEIKKSWGYLCKSSIHVVDVGYATVWICIIQDDKRNHLDNILLVDDEIKEFEDFMNNTPNAYVDFQAKRYTMLTTTPAYQVESITGSLQEIQDMVDKCEHVMSIAGLVKDERQNMWMDYNTEYWFVFEIVEEGQKSKRTDYPITKYPRTNY